MPMPEVIPAVREVVTLLYLQLVLASLWDCWAIVDLSSLCHLAFAMNCYPTGSCKPIFHLVPDKSPAVKPNGNIVSPSFSQSLYFFFFVDKHISPEEFLSTRVLTCWHDVNMLLELSTSTTSQLMAGRLFTELNEMIHFLFIKINK